MEIILDHEVPHKREERVLTSMGETLGSIPSATKNKKTEKSKTELRV
jgi:hypothetical protein